MIEPEDFAAWQASPVTEAVFRALRKIRDDAKAEWVAASWDAGNTDPVLLADLRARAQIVGDLAELTFEELKEKLDDGTG